MNGRAKEMERRIILTLSLILFASFLLFILAKSGLFSSLPFGKKIVVQIRGEIKNPGVYQLRIGSRLQDLISHSGGFTEYANYQGINLAQRLYDEDYIVVPTKSDSSVSSERTTGFPDGSRESPTGQPEVSSQDSIALGVKGRNEHKPGSKSKETSSSKLVDLETGEIQESSLYSDIEKGLSDWRGKAESKPKMPVTKINPNSATEEELETLPGVGPVIAGRIIEYRKKRGPFKSINELLRVKGIGQSKLSKMKPYLTLGGSSK